VSFVFYPNHQYGCPQLMHCPHVGGAALGSVVFEANQNDEQHSWLFRQLDGFRDENALKARRIAELEERVKELEAELKAERQKQFKAARPAEEEVSAGVEEENSPRKRGAPLGHPGWYRPTPTQIDRTLDVAAPARCPHCGAAVLARPDLAPYEHIQEDLLDGRPTTTCYRHEEGRCTNPRCRLWVRQAGDGEILRAKIGPQMRARGLFLRFDIGLPCRKVVGAIEGLDSLVFTPAALLGFEK
jgi:transposase